MSHRLSYCRIADLTIKFCESIVLLGSTWSALFHRITYWTNLSTAMGCKSHKIFSFLLCYPLLNSIASFSEFFHDHVFKLYRFCYRRGRLRMVESRVPVSPPGPIAPIHNAFFFALGWCLNFVPSLVSIHQSIVKKRIPWSRRFRLESLMINTLLSSYSERILGALCFNQQDFGPVGTPDSNKRSVLWRTFVSLEHHVWARY